MYVGPLAEKFNKVRCDHGHTHKCDFPVFDRKYPLWANSVKKNQNRQPNGYLDFQINSNMQNSMMLFTFSVLNWKHPFLVKFNPKNQNCQFKLKFGTQTNLNIQNSMVVFTLFILDGKHTFWKNFGQKIKIVSLN